MWAATCALSNPWWAPNDSFQVAMLGLEGSPFDGYHWTFWKFRNNFLYPLEAATSGPSCDWAWHQCPRCIAAGRCFPIHQSWLHQHRRKLGHLVHFRKALLLWRQRNPWSGSAWPAGGGRGPSRDHRAQYSQITSSWVEWPWHSGVGGQRDELQPMRHRAWRASPDKLRGTSPDRQNGWPRQQQGGPPAGPKGAGKAAAAVSVCPILEIPWLWPTSTHSHPYIPVTIRTTLYILASMNTKCMLQNIQAPKSIQIRQIHPNTY